jgi:voltage-gated potassium channel
MASEMMRPTAVNFLDTMLRVEDKKKAIRFEDLRVRENSEFENITVEQAGLRRKYNLLVVGIKPPGSDEFIYSPPSDYILKKDSELVVLGEMKNIHTVKELFAEK